MVLLVQTAGVLFTALGSVLLARPALLRRWLEVWQIGHRIYWAIAMRFVFGSVFVLAAPHCRVSGVILVLGWVMLASGAVGLLMGMQRLRAMVQWYQQRTDGVLRAWSLLALVLGVLVLYSA